MKYRAVANPLLYHCGYYWLVVDANWNQISKHVDRQTAEKEAERLNVKRLSDEEN